MDNKDLRKNGSGYVDDTAYNAIRNIEGEKRFFKLLDVIYDVCRLAGFEVEEHIVLKDKRTGKVWR